MAATKDLMVRLIGKDQGALNVVGKLGDKAEETGKKTASMGDLATKAMIGIGVAAGAMALKSAATFEKVGGEVMKLQRYTGESAESMSRLRFAAQQSGLDVDTLTKSLGIASKNLEKSKDSVKQFGVSLKDAQGNTRPMSDVLLDVADKFQKMPNGAEKTAAAMALFGRAGADMIPFLNRGRDGIADLMAQTDKYGLVLSGDNLKAVKDSKAAHRELDAALDGLQVKIGAEVLPKVTWLTKGLAQIPGPVAGIIGPTALAGVGLLGLAAAGKKTFDMAAPLVKGLGDLNTAIKASGDGAGYSLGKMGAYAAGIGLTIAAIQHMNSASEASNNKLFKDLDFSDLEAANQKLNQTGESLNAMGAKWDSYSAAEKLAHAEEFKLWSDGSAQQEEHRKHLDASIDATKRLGDSMGISAKEAERMVAEMHIDPASVPFDVLVDTMTKYKNGTLDAAGAQKALKGATSEATDEIKGQADAMKATLDPLFGMTSAIQKHKEAQAASAKASRELAQAQKDYDYAVLTTIPGSQQRKEALEKLTAAQEANRSAQDASVRSALDVQVATDALNKSVMDGTTSVEEGKKTLQGWVAQGLLTQEQANNMSTSFAWAGAYADNLAKNRVGSIQIDVSQAMAALAALGGLAAGLQKNPEVQRGLDAVLHRQKPIGAASGGYFPPRPGGHLVNVAEGGEGEVVAPQRMIAQAVAAGGGRAGGGDIHVHIEAGALVHSNDIPEMVRNGIIAARRRTGESVTAYFGG